MRVDWLDWAIMRLRLERGWEERRGEGLTAFDDASRRGGRVEEAAAPGVVDVDWE